MLCKYATANEMIKEDKEKEGELNFLILQFDKKKLPKREVLDSLAIILLLIKNCIYVI